MSNKTKKLFNFRAFVSVLAGFSFVLMTVTGLVLFFTPSCRAARETSWVFWGHDKDQWVAVHVWFSIAFVVASLIHIYLNWTSLINYFKTKLQQRLAFRAEWISALVICGTIYAGTVYEEAPFSSLIAWKETFKQCGSGEGKQGRRFGQTGMGVLESQFTSGVKEQGLDTCWGEDHAQQQIGRQAGRGTGQKTLRQFCNDERIELSWALSRLRNEGFTDRETMTMREIADGAGIHPRELRAVLQAR
ncbi:MAG: DUF4405 domain-containing protein [Planctomycetota bacterium]|jgi:hypothetical protein